MLSLAATINWGNDGPDLDRAWGNDMLAALPRGESGGFYDFQCAKIMNSSGNEIETGTPRCKLLLFNSKVFHAKTQR